MILHPCDSHDNSIFLVSRAQCVSVAAQLYLNARWSNTNSATTQNSATLLIREIRKTNMPQNEVVVTAGRILQLNMQWAGQKKANSKNGATPTVPCTWRSPPSWERDRSSHMQRQAVSQSVTTTQWRSEESTAHSTAVKQHTAQQSSEAPRYNSADSIEHFYLWWVCVCCTIFCFLSPYSCLLQKSFTAAYGR